MIFFVNLPVAVALAVIALKVIPSDIDKPRWRGLDLRGAVVATTSLGAIVYAITQGTSAGWTSTQTLGFALLGLVGLAAFGVLETKTATPLLNVGRLSDRAIGGGLFLMLAAAGSIFGLFFLCSVYLQNVLGMGPLTTGLSFIPLALAAGVGAHTAGHLEAATASASRSLRHSPSPPLGWRSLPTSAPTAPMSATSSLGCS